LKYVKTTDINGQTLFGALVVTESLSHNQSINHEVSEWPNY